jgi:hypothetical protein
MRTSLIEDLQANRILQNWCIYSPVAVLDLALLVCEALPVPYAVPVLDLRHTNLPSTSVMVPSASISRVTLSLGGPAHWNLVLNMRIGRKVGGLIA